MKKILWYLLVFMLIYNCKQQPNPFVIKPHNLGLLTDSTQVKDLNAIFKNDSVVKYVSGDEFQGTLNSIEIFEKNGTKLLDLAPREALDSTSVIASVQIIDPRYKTDEGISIKSTFGDISKAYTIKKVDNLLTSIVVSVKEIDATFTIDKKELPMGLQLDPGKRIDPIQIPDNAKIKYFILHW